jgi:hypothetical protein
MEISVSLSAINGFTRRRAEIPDNIFFQINSVLGFQDKCWSIVVPRVLDLLYWWICLFSIKIFG